MNYKEKVINNKKLNKDVFCFWQMSGIIPTNKSKESRVTPKGQSLLIFNFGDSLELLNKTTTKQLSQPFFAYPAAISSTLVRQKGNVQLFGISFIREGLYKLTCKPIWELIQCFPDNLNDLLREIYIKLKDLEFDEKCLLIEEFLSNHINYKLHSPTFYNAIDKIDQNKGVVKLQELSESLGVSLRQLQRLFKKRMGISPKDYCKIVRLNSYLLDLLSNNEKIDYLDLVVKYNYHDQPHLINEIKAIVNSPPKKLIEYRDTLYHSYKIIK